jgi:hypothetical protein
MMRSIVCGLLVIIVLNGAGIAFAGCQGGKCNRTPIRSYFQKVKPVRHILMLDRK